MTKQETITSLLRAARQASTQLAKLNTKTKNVALAGIAAALLDRQEEILAANAQDIKAAQQAGKSASLIDRLTLNSKRLADMSCAVTDVIALRDPVGEIYDLCVRPNNLRVGRMRIPLGVIGIVFEARPNVIVDASSLCLKSGNAVVLRGGSEAIRSNCILGEVISAAIRASGLPPAAIQVVEDPDHELVLHLLRARGLIDLVIPRGGESLIRFVEENAMVPLIYHYQGVCHIFIDESADFEQAQRIILNAKIQRPGVCNAMETLLIHQAIASSFLPPLAEALRQAGVVLRGCSRARQIVSNMESAKEDDWYAEYLDLILAVRVVDDLGQALTHIEQYGSRHTDAIITESYERAGRFLREVQSSCVLVNASTRFNDGGELGLGAEIGISTSKLHAFGPMGLTELTASKFVVLGNGQVRE